MGEKPTTSEHLPQQQPVAAPQQPTSGYLSSGAIAQSTWQNGMWDCFAPIEMCLKATFVPCFVYGKTQHLLRDPTLAEYKSVNDDCLLWAGAQCCGLGVIFTFLQRQAIREKYGIAGDVLMDGFFSWCCHCCALMQQEKEVVNKSRGTGGGVVEQGYVRSEEMVMR